MDNKIIQYLDELLSTEDVFLIEIIFNYSLWLVHLSYDRYEKHAVKNNKFKLLFKSVITRSLKKKYDDMTDDSIKSKFNDFVDFEVSFGKFGLHSNKENFYEICNKKLHDFLYDKSCKRLVNLGDVDKKIINFLLNLISMAIEKKESMDFSEYGFNDEGHMLKVNTKDWATQFNIVLKERLKLVVDRDTNTFTHGGGMLGPNEKTQVINFWEFYDRLLRLGIGYYVPWITKAGKIFIHFKIFKKIFKERSQLFTFLKKIPNMEKILANGRKASEKEELKKSWN